MLKDFRERAIHDHWAAYGRGDPARTLGLHGQPLPLRGEAAIVAWQRYRQILLLKGGRVHVGIALFGQPQPRRAIRAVVEGP